MTRADQIHKDFEIFHLQNPMVWELFKKYVLIIIKRDFKHYGASAVFERIRWHVQIETTGQEFKLNNNFCAYYARMFEEEYPGHGGFFRSRELISGRKTPK